MRFPRLKAVRSVAANPFLYVIGFALMGAGCIVAGINTLAGSGYALVTAGSFLIAGAWYITKGLRPNG